MARAPRRPAPLLGKVFYAPHVVKRGLLTVADLRTSAWRRLFRNVYADALMPITHRTRCAALARWLLPEGTAIAGRSAALFHGGVQPPAFDLVEVLTSLKTRRTPVKGTTTHVGTGWEDEVVRIGGVPVTTVERTCWDVANWHALVESVVVIDSLLASTALSVESLREYAAARKGQRGWRRLAQAADLADRGAESPQESRLRVRLVLAGIPRPRTQHVIRHDGRFVARADLAWPEPRVAVEYDGRWHAGTERFDRDRERLNRMRAAGWVVLHVTASRMRDDFSGLVAELRAVLTAARARTVSPF